MKQALIHEALDGFESSIKCMLIAKTRYNILSICERAETREGDTSSSSVKTIIDISSKISKNT